MCISGESLKKGEELAEESPRQTEQLENEEKEDEEDDGFPAHPPKAEPALDTSHTYQPATFHYEYRDFSLLDPKDYGLELSDEEESFYGKF